MTALVISLLVGFVLLVIAAVVLAAATAWLFGWLED